jgi:DNA-binding MarR family transcriptional regulator
MKSGRSSKQATNAVSPEAKHFTFPVPDAGQCNGTALRMATRRISQLYDVILAPCGLRSTQLSILTAIARSARPTISEIANAMVIDRSALAHNLKPLKRSGLVRIVADDGDKRTRLIVLTADGRAKLSEALPLWEEAQRSFRAAFGTKNAEAMRASLNILTSANFAQAFQGVKKD